MLENNKQDYFNDSKTISENDQRMLDAVEAMDFLSPNPGKVVEASFVKSTEKEILFDVGFKDYIRVENKGDEQKVSANLTEGDLVPVAILSVTDRPEYTILGSVAAVAEQEAKRSMIVKMKENVPVMGRVKSMNPAGFILEVVEQNITLIGFMPNTLAGANRISDPQSIINTEMEVMIESYSRDKGTYILSRRRFLETLIKKSVEELEVGPSETPYTGTITGSTHYGVFVEFNNCLTGLIHKGNLNMEGLRDAGFDNFQDIPDGTQIEFFVKEVLENNRIILTQNFKESLWDTIKPNDTLTGKVIAIKKFGALVRLDDETKGVIKNHELNKSDKTITEGSQVKVKVINVQKNKRNISLAIA